MFQVCSPHTGVFIFTRKATRFPYFLIVINTGADMPVLSPEELKCTSTNDDGISIKDEGTVVFHSRNENLGKTLNFKDTAIHLDKFDIVVVQFAADE